jgi:pseudouridine-5'-phosphate glycosidase/pseudouridine kinase
MPPPTNLNTAISVQNIIRSTGAIPATIALIAGKFHIGLNQSQLELISDTKATPDLIKLSRRDLAPAVALKRTGGTTIAGTMVLAHIAGIKVFATGGLGGVHRGGETCKNAQRAIVKQNL